MIIFVWLFQWEGNALYNIVHFGVPLLLLVSGIVEYTTNYIGVTRTKIVVHMGFIKTIDYTTPLARRLVSAMDYSVKSSNIIELPLIMRGQVDLNTVSIIWRTQKISSGYWNIWRD